MVTDNGDYMRMHDGLFIILGWLRRHICTSMVHWSTHYSHCTECRCQSVLAV